MLKVLFVLYLSVAYIDPVNYLNLDIFKEKNKLDGLFRKVKISCHPKLGLLPTV